MAPGMGRALAPGGAQGRGPEGQAGARLELAPGKKGRVTLKSVPDELSFDKVRLPPPPPPPKLRAQPLASPHGSAMAACPARRALPVPPPSPRV